MSINDAVADANNLSNDNVFNAKRDRSSSLHQLKKLVKPFLFLLKKNKHTYKKSPQPHYFDEDEDDAEIRDNLANELLENEIFEDIDCCEDRCAVPVYDEGHLNIMPVFRGQRYIPVHFAKTEAGTFFWTSMMGADCDIDVEGDRNAITHNQEAELQACCCDRWAQA